MRCLRSALVELVRGDVAVARLVAVFAATQLASVAWDLPCLYGWENDGAAPRDLFGGLATNLTPGQGHRYPLFHYLLLAPLALPALLLALFRADGLGEQLTRQVLSVPVLTGIALAAKLLSVAMAAITLLVLARMARTLFGARAAFWTALFAALNVTVSYYGRTTNLDGPYMMWGVLAAERMLHVLKLGRREDHVLCLVFAALSVATKDQAYSLYVLSLPVLLFAAWHFRRVHMRYVLRAVLVGSATFAVCGGALLNPSGFATRLHALTGTNSQDWRQYEHSLEGVATNLADLVAALPAFFWPWPLLVLACVGISIAAATGDAQQRVQRLVPLAFSLSSLLTFTLVTARCEHRFVLPLGVFLSIYTGAAYARLLETVDGLTRARWVRDGLSALTILLAARGSLALHLTQWGDARRSVEAWLALVPVGTAVETYGLGVYLPRFDLSARSPYKVQRAGSLAGRARPPIPGLTELDAPYADARARGPEVLVITEGFANRFVPTLTSRGEFVSSEQPRYPGDPEDARFFSRAVSNQLSGYRLALAARPRLPALATWFGLTPVSMHGSTGQRAWVLVREGVFAQREHAQPSRAEASLVPARGGL